MKQIQISACIRRFRQERGLSQGDFGAMIGVSAQAVSKWERELACPDITLLSDIAEVMEISVTELLYGDETEVRHDA